MDIIPKAVLMPPPKSITIPAQKTGSSANAPVSTSSERCKANHLNGLPRKRAQLFPRVGLFSYFWVCSSLTSRSSNVNYVGGALPRMPLVLMQCLVGDILVVAVQLLMKLSQWTLIMVMTRVWYIKMTRARVNRIHWVPTSCNKPRLMSQNLLKKRVHRPVRFFCSIIWKF